MTSALPSLKTPETAETANHATSQQARKPATSPAGSPASSQTNSPPEVLELDLVSLNEKFDQAEPLN